MVKVARKGQPASATSNEHIERFEKEVRKGVWGMPRLSEAKKDVVSCEKLRGPANRGRSAGVRMGQPARPKAWHRASGADPGN